MKKYKLVSVEWNDSASLNGWRDDEEGVVSVCPIKTVGHLVAENKDGIAISQSISLDKKFKRYGDIISIPKNAIKKKRYLKG